MPLAPAAGSSDTAPVRTKLNWTLAILLALTTLVVYSRALRNPFVNFDDTAYVTENPNVQQGLSAATFRWAMTSTAEANWHPLTWLSHALDCQLFGLNPAGHHLTSVLFHVLNVVLVFWLLVLATGATWRSLFVAALFGLHPINVESVAWAAERKNVLCMFFFLLAVGAYGWYAHKPNAGRYLLVAGLFVLGLSAKPMVVTLPFVLLLLDFWPLQRVLGWGPASQVLPLPQATLGRLVVEKVPLLVLSAASSLITLVVQRPAMEAGVRGPIRLANALYAYAAYIGKTLWPAHLAAFYPYEGYGLSWWQTLLCLLLLTGVTAAVLRNLSRPYLAVGWLWFLGTLVPVIGLVQVGDQGMADRYAYLPLLGVFVVLVWGGAEWMQRQRLNPQVCVASAVLVIAVLSLLTWWQIGTWHSSYDLWTHALHVTQDNYVAENYAGSALLAETFRLTGQRYSEEAAVHFRNAVRINPRDPTSRLNLGADLHEHGRLQEAVEQYQTVLQLTRDPYLVTKALIDLGAAYHQLGAYDKARECYLQALQLDSHNRIILENLGKLGMDTRIQQLATAASAHPSPSAFLQLGQLQQAAGHIPEARASYRQALKLNPNLAEAKGALHGLDGEINR
ncbi:MAG: tetratricopeptide repeat protein [Candidatus Sulfotelmatobacter sp.]